MNFLSNSYHDDHYKQYMESNPLLAVCVTGSRASSVEQILLQSDCIESQMCVTIENSLDEKTNINSTPDENNDIFSSEWCSQQQTSVYSSIVVCIDWEHKNSLLEKKNLEQVNELIARARCRVVVAWVTGKSIHEIDVSTLTDSRNEIKTILGVSFKEAILVNNEDYHSCLALRRVTTEASHEFHKTEIHRLRQVKKTSDPSEASTIIRTLFKIGWHFLVIKDYVNSSKHFNKAYKASKTLFPVFPPFEVRLCASFILKHLVSLWQLCGEDLSRESALFSDIFTHIDWVKQGFASGYNGNCRNLALALRSLLAEDWYEILAKKSFGLQPFFQQELLISAINCFLDLQEFLVETCEDDLQIPSPQFVGTECSMDTYAHVLLGKMNRSYIDSKINLLITEAVSVNCSARNAECLYYQLICNKSATKGDDIAWNKNNNIKWPLGLATSSISQSLLLNDSNYYCIVHGCVDPVNSSLQVIFRKMLNHVTKRTNDPIPTLTYPSKTLIAPFTVVSYFREKTCATGEAVTIHFLLNSTSLVPLKINNVYAEYCNNLSQPPIIVKCEGEHEISAASTLSIEANALFPESGVYWCNTVEASVTLDGFSFKVRWNFEKVDWERLHNPIGSRSTFLHVGKPVFSFSTVECPLAIDAVEGEIAQVEIKVSSKDHPLHNCFLSFPSQPAFFSGILYNESGIEIASSQRSNGERSHFSIDDIQPWSAVTYRYGCACLKGGIFSLPLFFCCSTDDYSKLEITKIIKVSVDAPFTLSTTYMTSTQHICEEGPFLPPKIFNMHTTRDTNVLGTIITESDRLKMNSEGNEGTENNPQLYYAVQGDGIADSQLFAAAQGDMIIFHARLYSSHRFGVIIRKTDIIGCEGVEIVHTASGDMPCDISEGESISIIAHGQVASIGSFSPGFVRVYFSPKRLPELLLTADISMPDIDVHRPSVRVTCKLPSLAILSRPFSFEVSITNEDPSSVFFGHAALEEYESTELCLSGRSRWSLEVGPKTCSSTTVELIPLQTGYIRLPVLTVTGEGDGRDVMIDQVANFVNVVTE